MSSLTDTGVHRNLEATRRGLEREIAFNRAEARRLRDEASAVRMRAEQLDVEADRFQRQLEALPPATLGVLA